MVYRVQEHFSMDRKQTELMNNDVIVTKCTIANADTKILVLLLKRISRYCHIKIFKLSWKIYSSLLLNILPHKPN